MKHKQRKKKKTAPVQNQYKINKIMNKGEGKSQLVSGEIQLKKKIIHATMHCLEEFILNNSQSIHTSWRYKYISILFFERVHNNTESDSGGSQYYRIFHPTSTPL